MIRVGPAGWSYADWEGIVYPRPKPKGFHGLRFLAQYFDCMEINSSFYAMPRGDYATRWVELVADRPEFRFICKLNGAFTHGPELQAGAFDSAVMEFRDGIDPLAGSGKLAAILIQLPISFRSNPSAHKRLELLFGAWGHLPLAIELRHRSWFTEAHYKWLRSHEVSLVQIDLPASADHPPQEPPCTGPIGYLRLHGRNSATWFDRDAGRDDRYDYLYKPDELEQLVERTKRLATRNDETYVITNNHFEGKAIANGLEITAALEGGPIRIPETLLARYPHLRDVAKAEGQGRLF